MGDIHAHELLESELQFVCLHMGDIHAHELLESELQFVFDLCLEGMSYN